MGKGAGHTGKKTSHYGMKRRCNQLNCKKKSINSIGKEFYCKVCWRKIK